MNQTQAVGILGIGVYLPPHVRKNEDWPAHIVEGWRKRGAESRARNPPLDVETLTPGQRLTYAGMNAVADDPFSGSRERRILADDMSGADMQTLAAQDAMARAGVTAADIDVLFTWEAVPDFPASPNACAVHHALGLPARCFTLSMEAVCNTFHSQAAIAAQMIRAGTAKCALLVQANNFSRVTPMEDVVSTVFGDGATAVVLGPVSAGRGLIAEAHRTDSAYTRTLGCSVPGKRWHDEGRVVLHSPDRAAAFKMLLNVADFGKEVISEALATAKIAPSEVDFLACHQGATWLRASVQENAGLTKARFVDTFAWTTSLAAANVTLVMALAERDNMLRDGDVIATFAGGTGITYTSMVFRWGR